MHAGCIRAFRETPLHKGCFIYNLNHFNSVHSVVYFRNKKFGFSIDFKEMNDSQKLEIIRNFFEKVLLEMSNKKGDDVKN